MTVYKITSAEVPPTRNDDDACAGLLVYIRPPMQLNPTVVESFLTFGELEPLDPAELKLASDRDVKAARLLGSTSEQTTIYASIAKKYSERLVQEVLNDTVRLLQFIGATAIIDNSPTPDA